MNEEKPVEGLIIKYNQAINDFKEKKAYGEQLSVICGISSIMIFAFLVLSLILSDISNINKALPVIILSIGGFFITNKIFNFVYNFNKIKNNNSYKTILNKTKNVLSIKEINENEDALIKYLLEINFLNKIYPYNNITVENAICFYKLLNKSILTKNNLGFLKELDNLNVYKIPLTNKLIENSFDNEIGKELRKKSINYKIEKLNSFKLEHFSSLSEIENKNSLYVKINDCLNHNNLMNMDEEVKLNTMLDDFLSKNNNHMEIIMKYEHLSKLNSLYTLNEEDYKEMEIVKNKFKQFDTNVLNDINNMIDVIDTKYV